MVTKFCMIIFYKSTKICTLDDSEVALSEVATLRAKSTSLYNQCLVATSHWWRISLPDSSKTLLSMQKDAIVVYSTFK